MRLAAWFAFPPYFPHGHLTDSHCGHRKGTIHEQQQRQQLLLQLAHSVRIDKAIAQVVLLSWNTSHLNQKSIPKPIELA